MHVAGGTTRASPLIRVATWNTQWTTSGQLRADVVRRRISGFGADVAVLTESTLHLARELWTGITHADTNVYPGSPPDGAKVLIATHWPMQAIPVREPDGLPPGNVVAADVHVGGRVVRVVGLVIRYNAKAHFIDRLPELLAPLVTERAVVAGDFNLRIPGGPLAARLVECLKESSLTVLTSGTHDQLEVERPLVDHIATTTSLEHVATTVWSRHDPSYRSGAAEVTDHAAVAVDLAPTV